MDYVAECEPKSTGSEFGRIKGTKSHRVGWMAKAKWIQWEKEGNSYTICPYRETLHLFWIDGENEM